MWHRLYTNGLAAVFTNEQCPRCGLLLIIHSWAEFTAQMEVQRCSVKDNPSASKSDHALPPTPDVDMSLDVPSILEGHERARQAAGYHDTGRTDWPTKADYSKSNIRAGMDYGHPDGGFSLFEQEV